MAFKTGDFVKVEKDGAFFEGHVIPGEAGYITLKMVGGGYVAGFLESEVQVTLLPPVAAPPEVPKQVVRNTAKGAGIKITPSGKKITIITTGGTIASYVNTETGTVQPTFTGEDLLLEVPELEGFADFKIRDVFSLLSENMKPENWKELAQVIHDEIKAGADGIIVTHGTDTMTYSAAAAAYMIETPVPIIFTGSQRSPDRPSSDNHMNLMCAARAAAGDIAEVLIVMHGSTSDDFCSLHRAVKARKMHTSRRDTFKSVNMFPIANMDYFTGELTFLSEFVDYSKRGENILKITPALEEKCAIVKFVPGADPSILNYYIDSGYKGIVLEGVGLGHVSDDWVPALQKAADKKIPVVVTSQCINGSTALGTYETGLAMRKAGVVEAVDQLTESVFVKLMWLLGQGLDYEKVKELISTEMKGDMSSMIID
ncbi:Glu-tRNA(Gln) amidotransferase subunit GatD [Methanimicrococcus blatticola]|uniref:Glutamyl-tRNA(Gln) amidotransferase subunit D n=1 Tax=Methanimicrococcus blatticola TaxID=91560 RepID=A0A484F6U4_9EURY|nr:Glu-tRNA(Gln) amidotransferase subunit GatD [Methanimicrococcus blatticola]MBZ3935042.1 Glu-tRNA(Gln) amidotransferase subunit GatD [Methanimicrococcus blatticola]MCC2508861.1 Glu-tRNA(Gln) amidotransferase subunit GatD [Methanimicrococcus blatticola]TDQ71112.1 glutamyl-tRNA(Gln) amidotransferase subunit D [Methanimicrococcus blatticola]